MKSSRTSITLGTKNSPAEPITDSLLSDTQSLVARGKAFLYENGWDRLGVKIELDGAAQLPEPTDIIGITEQGVGLAYEGVATSFNIAVTKSGTKLAVGIERPILKK